jgi:DNA-binding MarR family transcriptional regulator
MTAMTSTSSAAVPAEPRWLRGDEPQAWLALATLMTTLPSALDKQLREQAGISHAYYLILAMLSAAPGRGMRMAELARRSGTSPSRLSHAVSSLEERGWVERRPCPQDGRGQIAVLTDAGQQRLVEIAPSHVEEVRRRVFDHLTPEQVRQLGSIAGTLAAALDAEP